VIRSKRAFCAPTRMTNTANLFLLRRFVSGVCLRLPSLVLTGERQGVGVVLHTAADRSGLDDRYVRTRQWTS
jgi:hypothetical protein